MKGITYYKLQSPYSGDITKNCSLDGFEVDSNFFNLEGRDIKSLTIVNDEIVITLLNGEIIKTTLKPLLDERTETSYNFDEQSGSLTITQNGVSKTITGFVTKEMLNQDDEESVVEFKTTVSVDSSLVGNGSSKQPLAIANNYQTGTYKPVISFIDTTKGESLPTDENVKPHDRYVTLENISHLGCLYDYKTVRQIACDLYKENRGWRIPTKQDWDDMLNAIEPDVENRTHNSLMSNKHLGKVAGKLLKSQNMWIESEGIIEDTNNNIQNDNVDCVCECNLYIGEYGQERTSGVFYNGGLDKYEFGILPVGYCDDEKNYQYYQKRAWYWTATNQECTNAYTKRFDYNKSSVYQDIVSTDYYLSLRLVKDYNGDNHFESEQILGEDYTTVLLPSLKNGNAIWTATNIALMNEDYNALLPSPQVDAAPIKKYFINEWNGKKWLRNEIKEGETVVVKEGNDVPNCVEYCVVNGVLTDVTSVVYESVVNKMKERIDSIEHSIKNETIRAIEVETQIQKEIATYKEINDKSVNDLQDNYASLKEHSDKVESNLNDEIARALSVEESLGSSINKLDKDIQNNTSYISDVETNLSNFKDEVEVQFGELTTNLEEHKDITNTNFINVQNELESINETLIKVNSDIKNEIERAIEVEENLNSRIEVLNKDIQNNTSYISDVETNLYSFKDEVELQFSELTTNLEEHKNTNVNSFSKINEKITTLDGKLLKQEGTNFDPNTGILTLNSNGGTNNVSIQFSLNFGEI